MGIEEAEPVEPIWDNPDGACSGVGHSSHYKCIAACPLPLPILPLQPRLPPTSVGPKSFLNKNNLQLNCTSEPASLEATCDSRGSGGKGYLAKMLNKLCLFSLTLNKMTFFKKKQKKTKEKNYCRQGRECNRLAEVESYLFF